MKRFATIFLALFCVLSVPAAEPDSAVPDEQAVVSVIRRYVTETRRWPASAYRIEKPRRDGQLVVCQVTYLADLKQQYPGGGKSFDAYYDPMLREVVRTLYFQ